jgi:hypothetical protein
MQNNFILRIQQAYCNRTDAKNTIYTLRTIQPGPLLVAYQRGKSVNSSTVRIYTHTNHKRGSEAVAKLVSDLEERNFVVTEVQKSHVATVGQMMEMLPEQLQSMFTIKQLALLDPESFDPKTQGYYTPTSIIAQRPPVEIVVQVDPGLAVMQSNPMFGMF